MKRIGLAVVSALALALAASGPAAAKSHHHRHHARHFRTHLVNITPTSPAAPSTTAPTNSAGSVVSFTNGLLTLKLNDGSTVSGMVTSDTEIECTASSQTTSTGDNDADETQSTQSGDQGDQSDQGQSTQSGDQGDQSTGGDDQGDENGTSAAPCDTTALTPNAVVLAAELQISSSGSTFKKVELG